MSSTNESQSTTTQLVRTQRLEELLHAEELLRCLLSNEIYDAMPAQTEDGCKDKNGQDCFADDMDIRTITYEMLQKSLSWHYSRHQPVIVPNALCDVCDNAVWVKERIVVRDDGQVEHNCEKCWKECYGE